MGLNVSSNIRTKPATDEYRDAYDRIFAKDKKPTTGRYQCNICGYKTPSKTLFDEHLDRSVHK